MNGVTRHFIYTENGISFEASAHKANCAWGKAIAIKIIDSNGSVRNRVVFVTHPEFPGFEELQFCSFDILLEKVKAKLNSGQFSVSLAEAAKRADLVLLIRLND